MNYNIYCSFLIILFIFSLPFLFLIQTLLLLSEKLALRLFILMFSQLCFISFSIFLIFLSLSIKFLHIIFSIILLIVVIWYKKLLITLLTWLISLVFRLFLLLSIHLFIVKLLSISWRRSTFFIIIKNTYIYILIPIFNSNMDSIINYKIYSYHIPFLYFHQWEPYYSHSTSYASLTSLNLSSLP